MIDPLAPPVVLGELSTFARIPPVTVLPLTPDYDVGEVKVVATYQDTVDDFAYLPFELQVNDWIVCINTPLDINGQDIALGACTVDAWGYGMPGNRLQAGVTPYRVTEVTGAAVIGTLETNSRCRVWLAVYRGLTETDDTHFANVSLQWIQGNSLLQATQASIYYQAPASQVARVTYANAYPELNMLTYTPGSLPYWFEESFGPADNPAINPDYEIFYTFFSGDDPSPTEEVQISSPYASWDSKYEDGWGEITFYTFVFTTQQVLFLDYDPLNAGPAGPDRLPMGLSASSGPFGIVTEDGFVLADEHDNELIWS